MQSKNLFSMNGMSSVSATSPEKIPSPKRIRT